MFRHLTGKGARYDVVHTASFPYFSLLAAALARRRHPFRIVVDWFEVWSSQYWREYLGPVKGLTKAVRPAAPPAQPLSAFEQQLKRRFAGRTHETVQYRFDGRGYLPDPSDSQATPPEELFVLPRAGGTARQLTSLGVDVNEGAWSPDATRLAIIANEHQRDEYLYERFPLERPGGAGGKRRRDGGVAHGTLTGELLNRPIRRGDLLPRRRREGHPGRPQTGHNSY